ncbi:universal stress protein [Hymenobacter caeli]|uniref:Nucleotide-binding universal stress UspA family protein n=1 Tax=Hymenobacter caeli TaxID=2735894 RepID=A0ABX2FSL6_9BACT|nr:universal stress protein [Hymenobacter caeli]NRT20183.1 nucleotide-binding universal stress UspA family protein [Hymenobacter caeli]
MTPSLVVLTDFYAVPNRALSYAAGLAVPLHAQLVLLHVRHDNLLAPAEYGDSYHTWRGEQKTAFALQQLATDQPVPTEVDISDDALPAAVREAVRHRHPLLLVLGRPDPLIAPEELVVGTAMNLLRRVPYPLLLVPGAGWDAFPPRRLLLLVDGQPFGLRPHQDLVRRLLQATGGTLGVVQVLTDGAATPDVAAVLGTVRANDLVDAVGDESLYQVYQPTVVDGALAEASRQQADLLVVVARPHGWLGGLLHDSVTARLLRASPIPVLVLPAEEEG